ncbi:MAG: hypothetical protein O7B99_14855, partial [Planctomycetota bacterium]|nr:hypothetical protein [Planctomycetota bacterium]
MKSSCYPIAASLLLAGCSGSSDGSHSGEEAFHFLSQVYEVDGLYRSMMGPRSREYVQLTPEEEAPE